MAEEEQRRAGMRTRGMTRRRILGYGSAVVAGAMAHEARALATLSVRSAPPPVALTGRVIWPRDPAYEEARQSFNARFSRFPAAIVVCDNTNDVGNAVRWARQERTPLRARSGGHSYEAFSVVDGGLVIDVGGLNQIDVDVSRGEAVIGAGVRLLDCYRRLWNHGVTIPAGTCPGVGIAGLTLGGGIGFLSRQYGLTCDNLAAVELVDADGGVLRASEESHPDLFWALRGGGGGNFGIATTFTFRVHPIDDVVTCTVTWPWDDAAEVLDAWQRWAPFVDERLCVTLAIAHPSAGTISATGLFTGSAVELPSLLEPLLRAGTPGAPQIQSLPFLTAAEQFAGPPIASVDFKNASSLAYDPLPAEAIATLWSTYVPRPSRRIWWGSFLWVELSRPSIRPQRRSFTAGRSSICSIRPTGGMTLRHWRPSPGFATCVRRWRRTRMALTSTTSTPISPTGRARITERIWHDSSG